MGNIDNIGERIKQIRRAKHVSQEKLAELVAMNHRTINRIENCHSMPTLETLDKVATALNVDIADFFKTDLNESRESIIENILKIANNMEDKELKSFYKAIYNFFI